MAREPRSSVRLDVDLGREADAPRPLDESTPFRIAILGDFRGDAGRAAGVAGPLRRRRPLQVDRDNLDEVMAQWRPTLHMALPDGSPEVLQFGALDDFHPDKLYERLPVFVRLRALRAALADRASVSGPASPTRPTPPTPELLANPGSLLDEIVGGTPAGGEDLQAFIRRIVAPHVIPELAPEQAALVAQVDAVCGMVLRSVLHHPALQALESLWRSIFLMVRRVETSVDLQIHLFDVSREELSAGLGNGQAAGSDISGSDIYGALTRAPGGEELAGPWALLVGAYTFGTNAGDLSVLGRLAALARAVGAPCVAAAHPQLVGCPDVLQLANPEAWRQEAIPEWAALRRGADARWLGLITPRFLVRPPYGEGGERCETLTFEELPDPVNHEDLLWANGAMAGAVLVALAFEAAGWDLTPGNPPDLDGLPLYVRRHDGEAVATPCAETLLTGTAVERLLEAGVMPLVCRRDGDSVRVIRFQSVAHPLAPLAGPWAGGWR